MKDSTVNKQLTAAVLLSLCLSVFCFATVNRDYSTQRVLTNNTYALNTVYQPSTTRDAMVTTGASIVATLSLSGGQTGQVLIQISPDNVTYTTVATLVNGNTGSLTIGLNTTQSQSCSAAFMVPKGFYFKLVSSGTATMTALAGQQVLL